MKEVVLITRLDKEQPFARHCKPLSAKASSTRRFWKVKERDFPLNNSHDMSLSKGEYVEVELPAGQAVGMAFMLFILPLILFVVIFQLTAFLGTLLQVLVSIGVFAGSFLIPTMMKKLGRKETYPDILRKLNPDEVKEMLSCNVGCAGCGGCG